VVKAAISFVIETKDSNTRCRIAGQNVLSTTEIDPFSTQKQIYIFDIIKLNDNKIVVFTSITYA